MIAIFGVMITGIAGKNFGYIKLEIYTDGKLFGLPFKKYKKLKVQSFGKLPIYKDYISIITQNDAVKWKEWLLNNIKRGDELPTGRCPFLFQFSHKSSCLMGIIEKSSDGQRFFPFSIFVVCKKSVIHSNDFSERFTSIIKNIKTIRDELDNINTIGGCYDHLKYRTFQINNKLKKNKLNKSSFHIESLYPEHKSEWPAFFVWPEGKDKQYVLTYKNKVKNINKLEEPMNNSGIDEVKSKMEYCVSPFTGNKSPVGESVKNNEDYQAIKDEIDQISLGGIVNWDNVIQKSLNILSKTSKDLNVAGYLSLGLFRKYGYEGLLYGLKIYCAIIKNFQHDNYFPKKENNDKMTVRIRRNSIDILKENLLVYIGRYKPEDIDIQFLTDILEIKKDLEPLINNISLDKPHPSLMSVFDKIEDYKNILSKKSLSVSQDENDKTDIDKKETDNGDKEGSDNNKEESKKNNDIKRNSDDETNVDPFIQLIDIANEIFLSSIENPASYQIRRISRWNNNNIKLPSLKKNTRNKEIEMRTTQPPPIKNRNVFLPPNKPIEIIKQCENIFEKKGTWCLDLNRYVVQAMERLPGDFDSATDVIKIEVSKFVRRFPEVFERKFSDGTPFADSETKEWIEDILEVEEAVDQNEIDIMSHSDLKTNFDEIWNLVNKNDISGALELLQNGILSGVGKMNEFHHRLIVAKVYQKFKREEESIMILEDLYSMAQHYHLEEWDPELFISLCILLDKAYRKNSNTNKLAEIRKVILKYNFKIPITLPALKNV